VEGAVERKRPAPCCEDCEMLHLTSRGRELLRVKGKGDGCGALLYFFLIFESCRVDPITGAGAGC